MRRRDFLKFSSLGLAGSVTGLGTFLTWSPRAHAATLNQTFYITDGMRTQADGTDVWFQAYSSKPTGLDYPAQSMIVQEGDTVNITIHNTLGTTHSFVIDGLVDSGEIAGGTTTTVSFTATAAGSYLFYDRVNLPYNRLTGLHGGLAIMPKNSRDEIYAGSPTFKQQLFWLYNDIDPAWHDAIRQGQTPGSKFKPRYFHINGISARPPGSTDYSDPAKNAFYDPRSQISGKIGDRTLLRVLNAGMCVHSMHWHGNHLEWVTKNGQPRAQIWKKDVIALENNMGRVDVIYPFEPPPDAYPPVTSGQQYVMHLHDEMTQTAGGGLYQFGAATLIKFK